MPDLLAELSDSDDGRLVCAAGAAASQIVLADCPWGAAAAAEGTASRVAEQDICK